MNVQRMIDFIERNLTREFTLEDVADRLGYSPFHCTRWFHRVLGMSLRRYIGLRRLTVAAQALRDTDRGILRVALDCGFSSQEALTRAFRREWGCTPGSWRRQPVVIRLQPRRGALWPQDPSKETIMNITAKNIETSFQSLPAQRFIGLRIDGATDYMDFWSKAAARGIDCHTVEGALASLTANAQIGGWYDQAGRKGYLYGVEMPLDYAGPVPEGMENTVVPAAEYAVFHHPPYDFATEDEAVWHALEHAVASWNPSGHGRAWDPSIPMWQRHNPEAMGQAWCKAVKKA
jgi:AraC-like DNA-binding protein/predicted transcriptional regulator YdeE